MTTEMSSTPRYTSTTSSYVISSVPTSGFTQQPTTIGMSTTAKPEKGYYYWKCILDKFSFFTDILSNLNELFGKECEGSKCSKKN